MNESRALRSTDDEPKFAARRFEDVGTPRLVQFSARTSGAVAGADAVVFLAGAER